jgi:hypothetical protein
VNDLGGRPPSTYRLTLETTMAFEDFEEGVLAVQLDLAKKRQEAGRFRSGLVISLIVGGIGGIGLANLATAYDPDRSVRPEGYVLGTIFCPILVFSMLGMCLGRYLNRKAGAPVSFWRRVFRGTKALIPWMIIAACIPFIAWVRSLAPAPVPPPVPDKTDWFGSLFPHAMWIVMTGLYFLILARASKPSLRKVWDISHSLHRTNRVTVDTSGATFEDGLSTRLYRWDAFVRFRETPNNFLLCTSEAAFEAIPKRAFADPAAAIEAGAWLNELIQPPEQRPKAFPVLPVAAPNGNESQT